MGIYFYHNKIFWLVLNKFCHCCFVDWVVIVVVFQKPSKLGSAVMSRGVGCLKRITAVQRYLWQSGNGCHPLSNIDPVELYRAATAIRIVT